MTTATTTPEEARQAAIDAIPHLSFDAQRILETLMAEVAHCALKTAQVPTSIRAAAQEDFQLMLQAFELAVRAAGGHYDEG